MLTTLNQKNIASLRLIIFLTIAILALLTRSYFSHFTNIQILPATLTSTSLPTSSSSSKTTRTAYSLPTAIVTPSCVKFIKADDYIPLPRQIIFRAQDTASRRCDSSRPYAKRLVCAGGSAKSLVRYYPQVVNCTRDEFRHGTSHGVYRWTCATYLHSEVKLLRTAVHCERFHGKGDHVFVRKNSCILLYWLGKKDTGEPSKVRRDGKSEAEEESDISRRHGLAGGLVMLSAAASVALLVGIRMLVDKWRGNGSETIPLLRNRVR